MAELYRFAAFVSYSSADARFAGRLHTTLEHYSIPKALGRFDLIGGGKVNRIYPICRDREEFGAGPLSERIQAALRASASLIVVCSPNAAASPWVQKEIESFITLGRQDRIYAIIADTAPLLDENGKDATSTCFPPAFRDRALSNGADLEPLAADARTGRDGFRNAWLKVVAGLIGVTPGQLIDRDRRRRRRQQTIGALGAGALAIIAAIGVVTLDTRNARSELTAYSSRLVGEGLSLDAMAFALAGLPAEGDVIPATHANAAQALRDTGAYIPVLAEFPSAGAELSPDARYAAVTSPEDGASLYRIGSAAIPADLGDVGTFAFSPDSRFLVYQRSDNTVLIRRIEGDPTPIPLGHAPEYAQYRFSPDGRYLLLDNADRSTNLWRLADVAIVHSFGRSDGYFSPDGRFLVTVDRQQNADLYDLRNLNAEPTMLAIVSGDVEFSSDSRFLAISDVDGVGLVFDLDAPDTPIEISRGARFGFSNDGKVLKIERGLELTLQRMEDASSRVDLGLVAFSSISPNGAYAAGTDRDGQGWLYDVWGGAPPRALGRLYMRTPPDLEFSPDGHFFAYRGDASDGEVLRLGEQSATSLGPVSGGGLQFSRDGRFLVVLEQSYFATVKNLQNGEVISLGPVTSFDLAPDGRRLITSSYEEERDVVRDLAGWTTTRSEVCRASGDMLRPLRRTVRQGEEGAPALHRALRGRPWNPCDWRGLLAFDHGWEGLAQWLRLVRIRYFNAPDYACEEMDAAGRTSEARRQACARPMSQPPQLYRPTAHP